jgi:hypothetical protein
MHEFLTTIFGDQTGNVCIALRNGTGPDAPINLFQWFQYPAQLDTMVSYAESKRYEDVYFSPLVYGDALNDSGKIARTPENSLTTQVIYSDADTAQPSDFRLNPSISVKTSAGRYHCYWMLTEPVSSAEASEIAHRVTTAHKAQGSDSNGWSANKVLRVPGSVNTSHGFPENVTVSYTGEMYDVYDVSGAYDDIDVETSPFVMGRVQTTSTITVPEHLPNYAEVIQRLPTRLSNLAIAEPDGSNRSELRWKLLGRLFAETDLTFDEVVSVGWHAPVSRKWTQEDARGIKGLIAEVSKIQALTIEGQGVAVTSDLDSESGMSWDTPELLTAEERALVDGITNYITTYVHDAGARVAKQNRPYDVINAWQWLTLITSEHGYIPRKNGPEPLGIYTCTLGETTTGKSQSIKSMFMYTNEWFKDDPAYNIGGNASASALGRKLLERNGKASFFNRDEAHGVLKTWVSQDWSTGMMEDLALLYDGKVPPQLRTGNWDESGKEARTYFGMHLMGTTEGIVGIMNKDMFKSGFLARFCWAIGETREITFEGMAEDDMQDFDTRQAYDFAASQINSEINTNIGRAKELAGVGQGMVPMFIDPEAARRLQEVKWKMAHLYESSPNWDILEPSLVRMGVTIRKIASALALAKGFHRVGLNEILFAIGQAEEWVANLLTVSSMIASSDFERGCNQIEEFIESKDGEVTIAALHRRFRALEPRVMQMFLESLTNQHRIYEFKSSSSRMMGLTKKEVMA